jgi:amino acid transporter
LVVELGHYLENIQTSETRKAPRLTRALGLWAAIAVIVGSMIGQAVFLVASDMARELGSPTRVLAVWIIGGIVVLFGAFCYAELGAAMPDAGFSDGFPRKPQK